MLTDDSAARKRIPMYTGLIVYFPDALAAVAALSFESNEKHNPGEPLHWSRDKSADHDDCVIRHMTDVATAKDIDVEIHERRQAAWRALAGLQLAIERKAQSPANVAPLVKSAS